MLPALFAIVTALVPEHKAGMDDLDSDIAEGMKAVHEGLHTEVDLRI